MNYNDGRTDKRMKHDEKNGKQSCGERGGGGVEKEEEAEQSGKRKIFFGPLRE